MRPNTARIVSLQLAAALALLPPAWAVQAADVKGSPAPTLTKTVPTHISLKPVGARLFLQVLPSPDRVDLYAGARRLARIQGNRQTRFDITRYTAMTPNGRLRVVATDSQGRTHTRTLDVSAYGPAAKSAPGAPSAKVQSFLQTLMKARSADSVRTAYHGAHFSAAEKRQLEQALKTAPYAAKLRSLGGGKTAPRQRMGQQKRAQPSPTQARELGRLNEQARALFRRLQAPPGTAAPGTPGLPLTSAARSRLDGVGAPRSWRIDTVDPQPAEAGRQIHITGAGFGSSRGSAELAFVDLRLLFPLTVDSWSDTRIVATIPSDASSLLGESERSVRLWVKPQDGGGLGPARDIVVRPDPRTLAPTITVLSSDTIMPGQELTIGGRHFRGVRYGTVEFRFGAHRFAANIQQWLDDVIRVRLPEDIAGMVTTAGEVVVRTHDGRQASHAITFRPSLETAVVTDTEGHVCWGLLGHKEHIQLWSNPLINEWKVVGTERRKRDSTIFSGCEFERRPTAGSSDATTEVVLWCDAFSWLTCDINLTIEGPAGTPHGAGGRRSSPVPFP